MPWLKNSVNDTKLSISDNTVSISALANKKGLGLKRCNPCFNMLKEKRSDADQDRIKRFQSIVKKSMQSLGCTGSGAQSAYARRMAVSHSTVGNWLGATAKATDPENLTVAQLEAIGKTVGMNGFDLMEFCRGRGVPKE